MIPPFELHRPGSVGEVIELRRRLGPGAALLCGGTELLLVMKLGMAYFEALIDIKRVPGLKGIAQEEDGLRIGAATTHREIESSPLVLRALPALAEMERGVANVRVRNVGTIGGNLCFADPHSDPATFLIAADAVLTCEGPSGRRSVGVADFTTGPYETVLGADEILVDVVVPTPRTGTGMAHRKISLQERPTATVCVRVDSEGGEITGARVVVGSVGYRPDRSRGAEAELVGGSVADLEPTRLASAAEAAAAEADPYEDPQTSAEYKRHLAQVLTERTIVAACAAAATV